MLPDHHDNSYSLAVEGDDYMVPDPFQVTFDTMSVTGSLACINITIVQDSVLEGDHVFTVHLLSLSPDVVATSSPTYAAVVIADDESKCACNCRKYLNVEYK